MRALSGRFPGVFHCADGSRCAQATLATASVWWGRAPRRSARCDADFLTTWFLAVQLDDAYLGGERYGGKAGRGSENKVPFVAAASLNAAGQPMRMKLDRAD